ncbi:centromere protein U [Takifugu flavidus]|uniref:centromere protein U n=1 Tax=Takifugu flavidus TaxID=433684 RepID=UPI0025449623|nr:centromere protein U [Takifugu flavidus]
MQKDLDSPNLSTVEKASFLEGLQLHGGHRLHSTALEEHLNELEGDCAHEEHAERREYPHMSKAGAASQTQEAKRSRRSRIAAGIMSEEGSQPESHSQLVPSGRKKKASPRRASELRSVKTQKKRWQREPGTPKSKKARTRGDSGAAGVSQGHGPSSTSEDEVPHKDLSGIPAPKKARMWTSTDGAASRKNASGRAVSHRQRGQRQAQKRPEAELVLNAFLDFIDHYRKSVESNIVSQSINRFSSIVEEQLQEKICNTKNLQVLKQRNAQMKYVGQTKTQRLLDTKYELMRAERQTFLLQKQKTQLELRLWDLRKGRAFLHHLTQLNRQYLDWRHQNSEENEMYGASSLPALVQEVNHLRSTEAQLRRINNQLEKLTEQ